VKAQRAPVPQLLSIHELSELLRIPVPTIYRWRSTGDGPKGIRVGRHIRYAVSDVLEWLEVRKS
jgi:excisionase family DNA binding protein